MQFQRSSRVFSLVRSLPVRRIAEIKKRQLFQLLKGVENLSERCDVLLVQTEATKLKLFQVGEVLAEGAEERLETRIADEVLSE